MTTPAYAPLDDALERLSPYGTELANGNFNHAPMVAEELAGEGWPQVLDRWIVRLAPGVSAA
ncbi:MAG TPA: hypothetical protein VET89_11995, partial [Stellaceae bacterium]|nr:hypothetical protein [Stellaceae bacterium]